MPYDTNIETVLIPYHASIDLFYLVWQETTGCSAGFLFQPEDIVENTGEKQAIKVLAAIDGSPMTDLVLEHCARYAKISASDLMLLHVIEDIIPLTVLPDTPLHKERKNEGMRILARAERILHDHGVACKTLLVEGPVAKQIVNVAEDNGIDYIFMGSQGLRGLKRMLLGSVADSVIKYAHCAVTIIR